MLILLNDKLETTRLPNTICQDDFDRLLANDIGPRESDLELLRSSYTLDENSRPHSYVRQKVAKEDQMKLLKILRKTLPTEQWETYFRSEFSRQIRKLLDGNGSTGNILCFRRKFKSFPETFEDLRCHDHFDILGKELDPVSNAELIELVHLIETKLPERQIVEGAISWPEEAMNGNGNDVIKYTNRFVQIYTEKVQYWLDRTIDKVLQIEDNSPPIRMTERLYEELHHHSSLIRQLSRQYSRTDDASSVLERYLSKTSSGVPLVITGPGGSGKSTLLASVLEKLHDSPPWQGGAAIVRFCNTSANCRTLDQLIQGIVEQLSVMFKMRPLVSTADSYGPVVSDLLTDLPFPILLALDGLDQIESHHLITRWQWLPRRLPKNVWIVISVGNDSSLESLKKHLPDSCTYYSVPPLTSEDAFSIVARTLESRGRQISYPQRLQIEDLLDIKRQTSPQTALILADIASTWLRTTSTGLPSDPLSLIKVYLTHLESKYGIVSKKGLYTLARLASTGLSNQEALSVLSRRSDQLLHDGGSRYLAPIIWYSLCDGLRNYTQTINVKGVLTKRLSCRAIRHLATEEYSCDDFDDDLRICFTHPTLEYTIQDTCTDLTVDSCYQTHSLYRSHTEHVAIIFGNRYWEDIPPRLTDFNYLYNKIQGSDVFQAMSDIQRALLHDTEWNLAMVFNLLLQSATALCLESELLAPQLILRSVSQEINELGLLQETLIQAHKWIKSRHSLISRRERYSVTLHMSAPDLLRDRTATSIANLRTDQDHLVTLSRVRGELRLHNIRTGEIVRRLTGLVNPVDVKAIDDEEVAVLCGRTIQVFNLDDGSRVSVMKARVSARVPQYAVHNQTHLVAVAETLGCLNAMDINSGEVVTAYRSGVGRSLDSLLVSEHGRYCVCGDRTKRPSPLLVWDLERNLLLHDLRITNSDFVTSLASITNDGRFVACVYKDLTEQSMNRVAVYELESGQIHKKFVSKHDITTLVICSESMNLVVALALDNGSILVWSLYTGHCKHVLRGHIDGPTKLILSADGTKCLSYNASVFDPSVRLWDITEGTSLGVYVPDCELVTCNLSLDGTVVAVSLRGLADPVLLCVDWSKIQSSGVPYGNPDKQNMTFKVEAS